MRFFKEQVTVEVRTGFVPLRMPWLMNELLVESEPDDHVVGLLFNSTNSPAKLRIPVGTQTLVLTHRFEDQQFGRVELRVPPVTAGQRLRIACRPRGGRWIGRRNPLVTADLEVI